MKKMLVIGLIFLNLGSSFAFAAEDPTEAESLNICETVVNDNQEALLGKYSVYQMHKVYSTCEDLASGKIAGDDAENQLVGLLSLHYIKSEMLTRCRAEDYREKYCDSVYRGEF